MYKNFTRSAFALLLLFVLAACGASSSPYTDTAVFETSPTEEQAPETHHPESAPTPTPVTNPIVTPTPTTTPEPPQFVGEITMEAVTLAAGGTHTLAITQDGALWAWGSTTIDSHSPVRVKDNAIAVSASNGHSMVITQDGALWAWGNNSAGALGDGTTINQYSPLHIMDNVNAVWAANSLTGASTMAITQDGVLWAWGDNDGQLGDGTRENRHSPVRIMSNVAAVSTSGIHTMAITQDGVLWAWGANLMGQLGNGTTTRSNSPTRIMDNVIAVSAGGSHSLAITNDGRLWAWGWNMFGQLGDGTSTDRHSPIHIMDDVIAISSGTAHTMAITQDGILWAWGANTGQGYGGQLGDGTWENQHSPTRIMDNAVAVSTSHSVNFGNTIAATQDGVLWAWGDNSFGQLGDGTTDRRQYPTRIMDNIMLP